MQKAIATAMAAGAAGVALALAGNAHADPNNPNDQSAYLKTLQSEGINADDGTALYLGKLVCTGHTMGMDSGEVVTMLRSKATINSNTADIIRITANMELC
jgi:hypothetical protein